MNDNNATNILVLNVGGNPLPNYIVAKYCLMNRTNVDKIPKPDRIIFIYSKFTKKFFYTIRAVLGSDNSINLTNIEIKEINIKENSRNYEKIIKKLGETMSGTALNSIHLNITGGTKEMMLASFDWLKEYPYSKKNIPLLISDLDPEFFLMNTYLIYRDRIDFNISITKLRNKISLDFNTLFQLHGITHLYEKDQVSPFYETVQDSDDISSLMEVYSDVNNYTKSNDIGHIVENKSIDINIFDTVPNVLRTVKYNSEEKKKQLAYKFIWGGWFEDLIYSCILRIFNGTNAEVKKNIYGAKEYQAINGNPRKKVFELDIGILRGYEFFNVSVSTTTQSMLLKYKNYEAIYRAEQLGGIHGKAVIIGYGTKVLSIFEQIVLTKLIKDNKLNLILDDDLQLNSKLEDLRNLRNPIGINDLEKYLRSILKDLINQKRISKKRPPKNQKKPDKPGNGKDLLILVIGKNPLPNYVITKYLLKNNNDIPKPDKIMLLFSKDTKSIADRLKENFREQFDFEINDFIDVNLRQHQRNLIYIINCIKKVLPSGLNTIHLNYTGGTKPMSLGSRIAAELFENNNNNFGNVIFSYLDPKKFQLNWHTSAQQPQQVNFGSTAGDLREKVIIQPNELIKLHINQSILSLPFKNLVKDLETNFGTRIIRSKINRKQINIFIQNDNTLLDQVKEHLRNYSVQYYVEELNDDEIEIKIDQRFFNHFEFINFNTIQEIIDTINSKITWIENHNHTKPKPVIFLKGYQLFLIYFITMKKEDNYGNIKKEAFVARYLAYTLGGEHAIAIVLHHRQNEAQRLNKNDFEMLSMDLSEFRATQNCIVLKKSKLNLMKEIIKGGNVIQAWDSLT